MAFFWPIRKTGECAETQEDPYEENVSKPKRLRKESTSSDDSITKKHFGHMSDSSDSQTSESEEEEVRKIEEIPNDAPNDEEDEYEVNSSHFCTLTELMNNFFVSIYRIRRR